MGNEDRLRLLFEHLENDLSLANGFQPAIDRLRSRMRKRARLGDSTLGPIAVDSFLAMNKRMGSLVISLDDDILRNARHFLLVMLENYTTSHVPHDIQVSLDRQILHDLWRFGPGTSYLMDGSHAARKMCEPWTVSRNANAVVKNLRRNHPYLSLFDGVTQGLIEVRGSHLKTVPKNEETDRTIAFEPCGNMCVQIAAGEYISRALARIGLVISKQQPLNKALAQRGSLDGSLATMDLSSASDCIHPTLVRALFPQQWYDLLMASRSEEILLPSGEWVCVNMLSTMGNGFTFSLMTAIITSLVYAVKCRLGGPNLYINWSDTAVYGDDIIVPTGEYALLSDVLTRAGFIVNHDKSFCTGPFRESCGGDYLEGRDITPFYVKTLDDEASVYIAIDKVVHWCARESVFLSSTITFLFSLLKRKLLLVPEWENQFAGFRTTGVHSRYSRLEPWRERVPFANDMFLMPLACGGYVSNYAGKVVYLPRQFKTRYILTRSRLPKGFLDGRDPLREVTKGTFLGMSPKESSLRSLIASMMSVMGTPVRATI